MLYYDYTATVEQKMTIKDDNEVIHKRINCDVSRLNEKQAYNVRFFISDIKGSKVYLCGAIGYKNNNDPKELAVRFLSDLGFTVTDIEGGETTIKNFAHRIHKADQNCYVDSDDSILSMASIGNFRACTSSAFEEELIDEDVPDEVILKRANEIHLSSELGDEINRILSMPADRFMGHPVQYILSVDNPDLAKLAVSILATALFKAKRLKSRRIGIMEAKMQSCGLPWEEEDHETIDMDVLKSLYKSVPGGTIVMRPGKVDYESETLIGDVATIDDLAGLVGTNRRDCLSVMIFPKKDRKSAEKLKAVLNNMRFVEIGEELFDQNTAIGILKEKAEHDGISDIKSLLSKIPSDEDRRFYISDVDEIYSSWLDERLGTEVFPLYKDIRFAERTAEPTIGDAFEKLQNLVGLKNVKQVISEALDFNKYQKLYLDSGLPDLRPSRHMVFTGNPGTAKTTVARLFAQIMKDNKILPKGKLHEVGRKDLVGKYVGWTAKLVEKAFIEARGSVLFIDEAYSLCDDRSGMYGDEAINTIVQMMENQRDDTIVIFAGYPDKMQAFLDKNPGLRSRIAFHVDFDDYNEDELVDILKLIAMENQVEMGEDVETKVREILSLAVKEKDFGNGRFVRNIYERARMRQASRIVSMKYCEVTQDILKTLVADDFIMPDELMRKSTRRTIGFAS